MRRGGGKNTRKESLPTFIKTAILKQCGLRDIKGTNKRARLSAATNKILFVRYGKLGSNILRSQIKPTRWIMEKGRAFLHIPILLLFLASSSFAYEALKTVNGGSVDGVVKFTGASVPQDPELAVSSDMQYCGKTLPAKRYLIKDRMIKNAVVYIKEIQAGKAVPSEPLAVTSQKCEFEPHVALAFKGNKIIMKTEDPVLHTFDVHASLSGKELFHIALHEKGSSVTKTLSKTGLLELKCYVHPWQHAHIYIFDHPYAAISDENGKFVLKDIPPGTYTIDAWHEAFGTIEIASVKVESGKTTKLNLEFSGETNR